MATTSNVPLMVGRPNEFLGDGWTWSDRHMAKVENVSESISIRIRNGRLAIALTNTSSPEIRIDGEYLFIKMIMLTFFKDALVELVQDKRNL